MNIKALVGVMVAILVLPLAPRALAQTASTSASGAGSFSAGDILERLPRLFGGEKDDGILKEPTAAEKAEGAAEVEEKIDKANSWFKNVTGLGLDELARAAWKLFLWVIRHAIEWAWAIVAWLGEVIRS